MKTVSVHQASSSLPALLAEVERGEEVVIVRNGGPVARLTRYQPYPTRKPGSWRRLPGWESFRYDRTLFAPMTDAELIENGW